MACAGRGGWQDVGNIGEATNAKSYEIAYENITWETSTIRVWLNTVFCQAAFTMAEQEQIIEPLAVYNSSPNYKLAGVDNTHDRIFLLSIDEAQVYFADTDDRIAFPTAYAIEQGIGIDANGVGWWWLRSPGYDGDSVALVSDFGGVLDNGFFYYESAGIRPALWLSP